MIIFSPHVYPYIYIKLVQSIKLIEIYNINIGIDFLHNFTYSNFHIKNKSKGTRVNECLIYLIG